MSLLWKTHGYLSLGIFNRLITSFPTPREAEWLAGHEWDRGSSRGEQSRRQTDFVELSPHSFPWATPPVLKIHPTKPCQELFCELRAIGSQGDGCPNSGLGGWWC